MMSGRLPLPVQWNLSGLCVIHFRSCEADKDNSPGFYLTFWQLSTYDLSPPAARYDEEGSMLRSLSRQEDSKFLAADRSSDRVKRASANGHRQKRDRYNVFVQKLAKEFKDQTAARAFTMKRLTREKHHWFANSMTAFILFLNTCLTRDISYRSKSCNFD
jgi:hypothetical protein